MSKRFARLLLVSAPLFAATTLYQGCTVLLPYPGPFVLDLTRGFPHFDGDGEDSLLDRLFGYDDDDDDYWEDRYDD